MFIDLNSENIKFIKIRVNDTIIYIDQTFIIIDSPEKQ